MPSIEFGVQGSLGRSSALSLENYHSPSLQSQCFALGPELTWGTQRDTLPHCGRSFPSCKIFQWALIREAVSSQCAGGFLGVGVCCAGDVT